MILLGVDFGTVRVGLAMLDTSVGFALPWKSIEAMPVRELAMEVSGIARAEGVGELVVGVPMGMQGGDNQEMAQAALRFVEELRVVSGLPVQTEDERMTSAMVEAGRRFAGAGKGQVDKDAAAAALIVESYFERTRK